MCSAGVAYKVITTTAHALHDGDSYPVATLVARKSYAFQEMRCPSERYMVRKNPTLNCYELIKVQGLVLRGASEQDLPSWYREWLCEIKVFCSRDDIRWKTGRWLFESQWQPITSLVAQGTQKWKDEDGYVAAWYLAMFDILLYLMWIQHDVLFAPVFGRGDGN
jgi:hypothetical protein